MWISVEWIILQPEDIMGCVLITFSKNGTEGFLCRDLDQNRTKMVGLTQDVYLN